MNSSTKVRVFTLLCSFFMAIILHAQPTQWLTVTNGSQIPANAVVGGNEANGTTLFVALVLNGNQWQFGKTRKDWSFAATSFGDKEINSTTYKVLLNDREYFWQYTPANTFYTNAVSIGDKGQVFVCRTEYAGGTHVGATWQGAQGCAIGYGGNGVFSEKYSLLYYTVPQPKPDPQPKPAEAVVTNTATPTLPTRPAMTIAHLMKQEMILRSWEGQQYITVNNSVPGVAAGRPAMFTVLKGLNGNSNDCMMMGFETKWLASTNSGAGLVLQDYNSSSEWAVATSFRRVAGLAGDGISYESLAKPGYYIALQNGQLVLAPGIDSNAFRSSATFIECLPAERRMTSIKAQENGKYLMVNTAFVISADIPVSNTRQRAQFVITRPAATINNNNCPECVSISRVGVDAAGYLNNNLVYESNYGLMSVANGANGKPLEVLFRRIAGLSGHGFSYESVKYPGYYIRVSGNAVYLSFYQNSVEFRRAASFDEESPGLGRSTVAQF